MKRSKLILRTLFILGILSVYVVPLLSILFNINFRNIIGVDWPEFVLCMPFGASAYGVMILSEFMEQEQTAFIVFIIGILIPLMALIGCLMIDKSK